MSFDDLFALEEEGEDALEPPVEHERPAWLGPPVGELGVAVPLGVVLARTDRGVVAVSHALAFSTGVAFDVVAHAGGLTARQANRVFHEQHEGRMGGEELPEGFLRFGVELPDGRRVSNLGSHRWWMKREEGPAGPVLFQHGGGGGQSSGTSISWSPSFWLWPLPEPGLLRFYCEWPVAGIAVSHVDVETTPLMTAASGAMQLWNPDESGPSAGAVSTMSQYAISSSAGVEPATGQADAENAETVPVPAAQLRALEAALKDALQALRRAAG